MDKNLAEILEIVRNKRTEKIPSSVKLQLSGQFQLRNYTGSIYKHRKYRNIQNERRTKITKLEFEKC